MHPGGFAKRKDSTMLKLIEKILSFLPKPLQDLYHKYEEQLLYVLFGGLTTLISIVTKLAVFALVPDQGQPWRTTLAVTLSWIFAVTFAFFTNKAYVFKNQTKGAKEFFRVFASFYGARLLTFVLEEGIFLLCCDLMHWNETVITFVSQVLIFVANYVLSKLLVFRKKEKGEAE